MLEIIQETVFLNSLLSFINLKPFSFTKPNIFKEKKECLKKARKKNPFEIMKVL